MPGSQSVTRAWISALKRCELEQLYIFYGEEQYRRETALNMIKKRLVPDDTAGWDWADIRGRGVTVDEIAEAVATPPMTAEKKLVIVRDFDPLKNDITPVLEELSDISCVIFSMDDASWKPDKRLKAYKAIEQAGFFAEFAPATAEELSNFIRRCFADRGKRIEQPEIEYMSFLCTDRMAGLMNEIEKVSAYAHGDTIRREDIDAVATRDVEARIFDMCDELTAGHYSRALSMLSDLETAREEAIPVVAVIARQFRQLYGARLALEAQKDRSYIMELLGLRSSYIANRVSESARRVPLPRLRKALIYCLEADTELKSSRAAPYDIVRMLIMKYAADENR